jgi:hypothetical protein
MTATEIVATPLQSLTEILATDYPETPWLIEKLLRPGETTLLIGRQKEGKSTLALQLAIDAATGSAFLDRFVTQKSRVLYVDFENRPAQLKARGLDLGRGRDVSGVLIKSFDFLTQRDVGLFGKEAAILRQTIADCEPDLLILDPLRFAAPRNSQSKDETWAVGIVDAVSSLRECNASMAVILIHHTRKRQTQERPITLREEPRTWIENSYGSQALLAHVDNIWGLEADSDGFTFATIARSHGLITLRLEKRPGSELFLPCEDITSSLTAKQALYWRMLPPEFTWATALKCGVPNSSLDRLIRAAMQADILEYDAAKLTYRKIEGGDA